MDDDLKLCIKRLNCFLKMRSLEQIELHSWVDSTTKNIFYRLSYIGSEGNPFGEICKTKEQFIAYLLGIETGVDL